MDSKASCSKEPEYSGTGWVSGSNWPVCDGCPHKGVSECRTLIISCVLSNRYGFKGVLLKGAGRLGDTVGVRKQLAGV